MKNVMKTMMVVGVFAIFAFAPVNVTKTVVAPVAEPVEEVCVEVVEDALYCKVEMADGSKKTCWLCKCDEL